MVTVQETKSTFLENMWLPIATASGELLYPRLRKNKGMKILTLTSSLNYNEISRFVNSKLSTYEKIVAWSNSFTRILRLETVLPHKLQVIGGTRYEDSVQSDGNLHAIFPLDLINIDFTSQDCDSYCGRVEKELIAIEHCFVKQKNSTTDKRAFGLIYTTLLNGKDIERNNFKQTSDGILSQGWTGLDITSLPETSVANDEKIALIENIIRQVSRKHGYILTSQQIQHQAIDDNLMLSLGGIMKVV